MRLANVLILLIIAAAGSGCGVVSPLDAIKERMQRNDDVYYRYGRSLELVNVGDTREAVHAAWGAPRNTAPSYPEFDLYLAVRNSRGRWRALPGDYNELHRTTPYLAKVSYDDGHVREIYLFNQPEVGSSRVWCDESGTCGVLFYAHTYPGVLPIRNPLIVTSSEHGIDLDVPPGGGRCEVLTWSGPHSANERLRFIEFRRGSETLGLIARNTYLPLRLAPGAQRIGVWPNFDYAGAIEDGDAPPYSIDIDCVAGERHYYEIGPAKGGFLARGNGLRIERRSAEDAAAALDSMRSVRNAPLAARP